MDDNMGTSVKSTVYRFGAIAFTVSLFASLLLLSCNSSGPKVTVPYYTDASFTPQWETPEAAQGKDYRIASFSFTDQHGKNFSTKNVAGKVYLANFFFTSCKGICPKMLANMRKVSDHFKNNRNVLFLSHSVTPDMDSVARLHQYAIDNDITTPQWHLLTGNVNDIYNMARQSYFVEEADGLSKDNTEFLHTENMVLIDQRGHLRGLYNGTVATEVPRIISDIDALLQENQ
jgi:protein SCO1/2